MRRQRNLLGPQGMGGLVSLWGVSSLIESIQYGTVAWDTSLSVTGTATITAVDTSRAFLVFLGYSAPNNTANNAQSSFPRIDLTNTTTITATLGGLTGSSLTTTVSFAVVQYMPGVLKSVQSGTVVVNSATSATATIVAVNTAKTFIVNNGVSTNDAGTGGSFAPNIVAHRITLTNTTTVTANRYTAGTATNTQAFVAVEFF